MAALIAVGSTAEVGTLDILGTRKAVVGTVDLGTVAEVGTLPVGRTHRSWPTGCNLMAWGRNPVVVEGTGCHRGRAQHLWKEERRVNKQQMSIR